MASVLNKDGEKFSKISQSGNHSLKNSAQTIRNCLEDVLEKHGRGNTNPFTVADYGTADASVCLSMMNEIIEKVQKTCGMNKEIIVVLEDQARNDFNALFNVIYGLKPSATQKLNTEGNVFVFASGTTMYKQCVPSNSVDLAFSSLAVQMLSDLPCNIKDGVYYLDADEDEYRQFQKTAEKDWKDFVICRGKELKPGGKLMVLCHAKNTEGKVSEMLFGGHKSLKKLVKQMLSENVITQEEYTCMNFTAFKDRTENDFCKIFDDKDDGIELLGLELNSVTLKQVIMLPALDRKDKTDVMKRQAYAQKVAFLHRKVFYNTIFEGLSNKRPKEERNKIVDYFYQKLEHFACNAESHPPGVVVYAEVVISKKFLTESLE